MAKQSLYLWRLMFLFFGVLLTVNYYFFTRSGKKPAGDHFDAVIIPGGGIDGAKPWPWVEARLDAALEHDAMTDYYILLSRGTPHKPPPTDEDGHPLDESAINAQYLIQRGVDPSRILLDTWSLDTIGNAFITRAMHTDPRNWRKLMVTTNAFHMPRVKRIFQWVFELPPVRPAYTVSFVEVPDRGLSPEQSKIRTDKELGAVFKLKDTIARISDMPQLHAFLFKEHKAYAAGAEREKTNKLLASTY